MGSVASGGARGHHLQWWCWFCPREEGRWQSQVLLVIRPLNQQWRLESRMRDEKMGINCVWYALIFYLHKSNVAQYYWRV